MKSGKQLNVTKETDYSLGDRGSFPRRIRNSSIRPCIQAGPRAQPARVWCVSGAFRQE
jgi:hypothetical protein